MSDNKEETTFENKCNILAELWLDYRDDAGFEDFVEYNDLGLPLSFLLAEGLVSPTDQAKAIIDETFVLLLTALEIEDAGFESLDDLLVG